MNINDRIEIEWTEPNDRGNVECIARLVVHAEGELAQPHDTTANRAHVERRVREAALNLIQPRADLMEAQRTIDEARRDLAGFAAAGTLTIVTDAFNKVVDLLTIGKES